MRVSGWAVLVETIGSDTDSKHIEFIHLNKSICEEYSKTAMETDTAIKSQVIEIRIKAVSNER